jgi:hypothetical protein
MKNPSEKLEKLMAKAALIQTGKSAILPTGEIVAKGTPGAHNYQPRGESRILKMETYTYTLSWEQNMGGGRGTNMTTTTNDWETAKHIWKKCCKDQLDTVVRRVQVSVTIGKKKPETFDPAGKWPRPALIG